MDTHCTPDFVALIDRAIARETRANLSDFLDRYKHIEFGYARRLDGDERALILRAVDHFLIDDSFAEVGTAEFTDLTQRLSTIAGQDRLYSHADWVKVRNACFDAMACLKALEARIRRHRERPLILQAATQASNDL